jgi:hypothetical protein
LRGPQAAQREELEAAPEVTHQGREQTRRSRRGCHRKSGRAIG